MSLEHEHIPTATEEDNRLDNLLDALGDWDEFVLNRRGDMKGTEYRLFTEYRKYISNM